MGAGCPWAPVEPSMGWSWKWHMVKFWPSYLDAFFHYLKCAHVWQNQRSFVSLKWCKWSFILMEKYIWISRIPILVMSITEYIEMPLDFISYPPVECLNEVKTTITLAWRLVTNLIELCFWSISTHWWLHYKNVRRWQLSLDYF